MNMKLFFIFTILFNANAFASECVRELNKVTKQSLYLNDLEKLYVYGKRGTKKGFYLLAENNYKFCAFPKKGLPRRNGYFNFVISEGETYTNLKAAKNILTQSKIAKADVKTLTAKGRITHFDTNTCMNLPETMGKNFYTKKRKDLMTLVSSSYQKGLEQDPDDPDNSISVYMLALSKCNSYPELNSSLAEELINLSEIGKAAQQLED